MNRKLVVSNIGICLLLLLGLSYVSLYLLRYNPFRPPYTVIVELPRTGGLYFNSDVTYLGHPVGDVVSIRPVDGRVEVTVEVDNGVEIPRDTRVAIAGLSPVGEQYLDFQPRSDSRPYLTDGDVIALADTRVPVEFATMMRHVATLAEQVRPKPIRTVLNQLSIGVGDPRTDLRRLVDDSERLLGAAAETRPETLQLLRDANTVLTTTAELRPELLRFSDAARQLTSDIRRGRTVWRAALRDVPPNLEKVLAVLSDLQEPFVSMSGQMVPPASILANRGPGITALVQGTPPTAELFSTAIRGGWIHAILSIDVSDRVCDYDAGPLPQPWITPGPALDVSQHCKTYRPDLQQRGSYYAPRP